MIDTAAVGSPDERGWQRFGKREVFSNRWLRLQALDVQAPSGERFDYHVVEFPPVAIAAIVNPADEVLLLWRYRMPIDRWGYELLGGLVDPDEDPVTAAAREAVEESGWRPFGEPEVLFRLDPMPGNVDAPVTVFLWRDAEQIGQPSDSDEAGRLDWFPLDRVPDLVSGGQLLGAITVATLLQLHARFRR